LHNSNFYGTIMAWQNDIVSIIPLLKKCLLDFFG
jgi:hypothetical protein